MNVISDQIVARVAQMVYNTHSRAAYSSALRPFIGTELTTSALQQIVGTWGDAARATIIVRKAALKKLVEVTMAEGLCEENILDRVVFPRGKPERKRRALSESELALLYSHARDDEELLLLTLLSDTGVRIGTACTVKLGQLKMKSFAIPSKGDRIIVLYTTSTLRKLAHRMPWKDDEYIFSGKEPTYPRKLTRMIKAIAKRAGLDFVSPHWFRHTYITDQAIKHGIDIAQELAGHAFLSTTARYRHIAREELLGYAEASSLGGKHVLD